MVLIFHPNMLAVYSFAYTSWEVLNGNEMEMKWK